MSLNIGVFTLTNDVDYLSVATHIANYIADGNHTVALKESVLKEDLFKTAKAEFDENGTFVSNGVRYYPNGYTGEVTEDTIITVFGEVNILHAFEESFDKIYLVSTGRIDNKSVIDQYIGEISSVIKEKIELILLGASKEELSVFNSSYRCITITEHHTNVCPYNLSLRIGNLFAEKGIEVPVYHKNWTYEEVTYHYVPEPEKQSFFSKLGFGKKKQKDKTQEEPIQEVTEETEEIVSEVTVHEKKVVSNANQFTDGVEFVNVPAPTVKVSEPEKKEPEKKESQPEEPVLKEELRKEEPVKEESKPEKTVCKEKLKQEEVQQKEEPVIEKPVLPETPVATPSETELETKRVLEELERRNKELQYESRHDELTGALNRKAFETDIRLLQDYALIAFDVNNLKETNDTIGHAFGDKLLVTISKTIESVFQNIYRMGGDEFDVLISDATVTNEAEIKKKLEQIDKTLKAASDKDKNIKYSVAYGVAFSSEGAIPEVQALADERMYQDKANKKAPKIQRREKSVDETNKKGFAGIFRKKDTKNTPKLRPGALNIFVTGISHSAGTSYVAGSIASAITYIYDTDVWFDHKNTCNIPDNYMVHEVKDEVDRFNASKNGIVIQDKGVYEELGITDRNDMIRANMNILVSTAEESDLQKISQFIESQGEMIDSWLFAFNHVRDHQKRLLEAAMRDYNYLIVPFHDNAEIPEELLSDWTAVIQEFTK